MNFFIDSVELVAQLHVSGLHFFGAAMMCIVKRLNLVGEFSVETNC